MGEYRTRIECSGCGQVKMPVLPREDDQPQAERVVPPGWVETRDGLLCPECGGNQAA